MPGSAAITTPPSVHPAVPRAATYELLGRAFAYPDEAGSRALEEAVAVSLELVESQPLREALDVLETLDRGELEAAYLALFTASTSPDLPTFESMFVCTDPGQQTTLMADVAGFYRAFGLDLGQPGFRPDDLVVELEFMGFLCRKEAYAAEHLGAPRVRQTRRAQRMFLEEHLGRWAVAIGRRVSARATDSYYRPLGEALARHVEAEISACGARPDRVGDPRMPWFRSEKGGFEAASGTESFVALEDIPLGEVSDAD